MHLYYDSEGDVLEIIFNEALHKQAKRPLKLRDGMVLYIAEDGNTPVQLTIVNYKKATQLPVIEFDGWKALPKSEQERLLPVVTSSPVSAFFQIDPRTGYGHLTRPAMWEILSVA
ncbi:MAG: hypothetical protein D6681_20600 [Calditrichaeota bacterium]|nr:MAG: hypothetical protein D6681_20600 [Calditrichota bacterium]